AYDELAQAWALAIRESAKRGGGFHLQYAGWDQKLLKHNEDSGGRLQDAVNELRANVTYLNGPAAGGTAPSNLDERAAIRQQILSGTYGPDVSVGVGRCSSTFASLVVTSIAGIMAIIPDVPHVVVDIVVDGQPLPEYLDEDDDDSVSPTSIIKYVESVSGSHFGIRVNLNGMERKHLKRGNSVVVEYHLDAENVTCNKPRPELQDLGTIAVKLHYAHVQGSPNYHSPDSSKVNMPENIHEKHLKGQAISQQVKLGEAVPVGALQTVDSRLLEEFAVFNFRYRSRKDLQILCLIPRSPSPIPLEDRPEGDLNREELLELLRRQKSRQEEQVAIKQELKRERIEEDEDDDELTIIFSRPPPRKLKITADADTGIETIDLTDV
ncbi:hypothetical protein KCU97_g7209, partial [Aureobasidium melanogenum]